MTNILVTWFLERYFVKGRCLEMQIDEILNNKKLLLKNI